MNDNKYSYRGGRPEYSHLTEGGKTIMSAVIDMLSPKLAEALDDQIKELAKQKMMENISS